MAWDVLCEWTYRGYDKRRAMRTLILISVLSLTANPMMATEADKPATGGRLKFKQGPVCMCSTGLSEKEIRAAEQKRIQKSQPAIFQRLDQNNSSQKADRRSDEKE